MTLWVRLSNSWSITSHLWKSVYEIQANRLVGESRQGKSEKSRDRKEWKKGKIYHQKVTVLFLEIINRTKPAIPQKENEGLNPTLTLKLL